MRLCRALRNRDMASPVALITGASTGIGYELAKLFAADGYDLILVARSKQRLESVAQEIKDSYGTGAAVLPADLSDPGAPAMIRATVEKSGRSVDVLVNNAGFGTNGAFADLDLQGELNMIQVNVTALVELTHLFLGDMIARKSGKILNVASTAGFQPGPLMANYYASKAYVLSFSEGLAEEVRSQGVSVTCLCPGATETPFFDRAKMDGVRLREGGMNAIMSPEDVARIGYRAMNRGKTVVISGLMNKLLAFSVRLTPRAVIRKIAKYLNGKG